MNFLDRFRYRYDNLKELDANISSDKKNLNYNNPILKSSKKLASVKNSGLKIIFSLL